MNTNTMTFEAVRSATFSAARQDGVLGAATLMGMAGKARWDDSDITKFAVDEYHVVKAELREKLDAFAAECDSDGEDEQRMLYMQQGGWARELVGETLPELLLDAEQAFVEVGFTPITKIDNDPLPVRRSIAFWHPEMPSGEVSVLTCKICNIPVPTDGGRIDPENS